MNRDILIVGYIAAWHLLLILMGMLPMRRSLPRCKLLLLAGLSYIFNGTLLIVLSYLLDLFGVFSWETVWLTWLAVWVCSFLVLPRGQGWPTGEAQGSRVWLLVALATLIGAYVRFYDAVTNLSFACVDSYVLCSHLSHIFARSMAHVDYMAGLLIFSGLLQWGVSIVDIMRFAPQVMAVLAIPLGFAFWQALFGTRAACLATILLGGSAFCRPLLFYHTLFAQLVTVGLCLPMFIFFSIRAVTDAGGDKRFATFAAVVTTVFFALTSTYLALVLVTLFALWTIGQWIGRRFTGGDVFRGMLIAAVVPLCAIYYYAFALPYKAPEIGASVTLQSRRIIQTSATPETGLVGVMLKDKEDGTGKKAGPGSQRRTSPVLRAAVSFVDVKRIELIRPSVLESITILAAFAAGAFLFVAGNRERRWALSFSGFMILACVLSSVTGILELPGYKGRALYLMLMILVPGLCCIVFEYGLPLMSRGLERNFHRGAAWLGSGAFAAGILSCLPSVITPPVIGANVALGSTIITRQLPEDNAMMRFLISLPAGEQRYSVIYIASSSPQAPRQRGKNVTLTSMWDTRTEFLFAHAETLPAITAPLRNRTRDIYAVIASGDLKSLGGWVALSVPEGFWTPVFERGRISVAKLHETYRNTARERRSR